jgi:hypothetical protein
MIVGLMLAKLHLKCVWLLLSVLLWKMPFSDSYLLFFCQRGVPARASVTMISSQDSLQSQALFNIKDSNKVDHHQFPSCNLQSYALDSYIHIYVSFCRKIGRDVFWYVSSSLKNRGVSRLMNWRSVLQKQNWSVPIFIFLYWVVVSRPKSCYYMLDVTWNDHLTEAKHDT